MKANFWSHSHRILLAVLSESTQLVRKRLYCTAGPVRNGFSTSGTTLCVTYRSSVFYNRVVVKRVWTPDYANRRMGNTYDEVQLRCRVHTVPLPTHLPCSYIEEIVDYDEEVIIQSNSINAIFANASVIKSELYQATASDSTLQHVISYMYVPNGWSKNAYR